MSSDDWNTEHEVADRLVKFWGGPVALDPCSNDRSVIRAKRRYTAGGLHLPWDAPTVFKNEPYSRLLAWALKTEKESKIFYKGKAKEIVGLEPVATSTAWWEVLVRSKPLLCFTKRLSFLDETGQKRFGARFDTVMPVWLSKKREDRFVEVFEPILRFVVPAAEWRKIA